MAWKISFNINGATSTCEVTVTPDPTDRYSAGSFVPIRSYPNELLQGVPLNYDPANDLLLLLIAEPDQSVNPGQSFTFDLGLNECNSGINCKKILAVAYSNASGGLRGAKVKDRSGKKVTDTLGGGGPLS